MQIANKVFVVTGAGNGIGRQVALALARRGARVAGVDRDEKGLEETTALASSTPGQVSTHGIDVTDRAAVKALPPLVIDRHGQVDGIVNIAGIIHRFAPFTELSDDEIDRIVEVNWWGTVNMCRTFLPILLTRPQANVTNMSSLAALIPFAGQIVYGATKGAVKLLSEGLHAELIDSAVNVVTVFPGNISTNLSHNSGVQMIDPGGRKVRSTTPEVTAEKIIDGIADNRFRVIVGADAHVLNAFGRVSPKHTTGFVARQMRSVL